MTAYFNECDPKAAAWLRELIRADVIVPGDVDERDIRDVRASDLDGYTQCHFFAGIGGWSYALRLARWPDTRAVWTGSCPCQPFSAAGKRAGFADERHLWPHFYRLIGECRPPILFGEQVASPAGMQWLDVVLFDLENENYAVGAADLCAASCGAPHIRQRLFWMGHADCAGLQTRNIVSIRDDERSEQSALTGLQSSYSKFSVGNTCGPGLSQRVGDGCLQREALASSAREAVVGAGDAVDLGQPPGGGCERIGPESAYGESLPANPPSVNVADADGLPCEQGSAQFRRWDQGSDEESRTGSRGGELSCQLGDAGCHGAGQHARELSGNESQHEEWSTQRDYASITAGAVGDVADESFWSECDWLACQDGKSRPVEPGTFPLAHGISGRVGLLRGYGNAIVPQVAAQFISAYLDIE